MKTKRRGSQTNVCCACIERVFYEFLRSSLKVYNDLTRGNTMDRLGIDGLNGAR